MYAEAVGNFDMTHGLLAKQGLFIKSGGKCRSENPTGLERFPTEPLD